MSDINAHRNPYLDMNLNYFLEKPQEYDKLKIELYGGQPRI